MVLRVKDDSTCMTERTQETTLSRLREEEFLPSYVELREIMQGWCAVDSRDARRYPSRLSEISSTDHSPAAEFRV
ncbi:hypothetical protein NMY22_g7483 [Coprinellus aureogranulatus]|nr:hypothetical protein NMY22_g7483 [Coprinellus aureogranulatus]